MHTLGPSVGNAVSVRDTAITKVTNDISDKSSVKQSVGIACMRFNGTKPEVLLVCKRYTYGFDDFVHCRYTNHTVAALFNNMTCEEKLDILSLNFDMMWYRIWLQMPRTSTLTGNSYYVINKNKFESTWLIDGGARLRKLIQRSKSSSRVWEMPKGRKKSKNEPAVACAIREFAEETTITKKHYRFIPGVIRTYSFEDAGVTYINTYYLACMNNNNMQVGIKFDSQHSLSQLTELCDIKWMDIENVRLVDVDKRLENFIGPLMKIAKQRR